jgi:glycosyltransferase involved in cell wall biosynthesis
MKSAILLSAPYDPAINERVQGGLHPKPDFLALAEALGAEIIAPEKGGGKARRQPFSRITGFVSRATRFARIAWAGFRRREEFDLIVSDVERVGIILALLLKATRSKTKHVMICHGKVVHPIDLAIIRLLRLHSHIDRFVCYGPFVAKRLHRRLKLPLNRVVFLAHPVDHHFWHANGTKPERLIVSAGMLKRDYATLIQAVRGLDVTVQIAASSPWMPDANNGITMDDLPPNVKVARYDYASLRDLYARALFVAIPLHPNFTQSGSLVLYEAMAMGKSVIITATAGQEQLQMLKHGETGYFVAPGDVQAWRDVIVRLLDDQALAGEMGMRARRDVEQHLNLDAYTRNFVQVVQSLEALHEPGAAMLGSALTKDNRAMSPPTGGDREP